MGTTAMWIGQDFDRRLDNLLGEKQEIQMVAMLGELPAGAQARLNALEQKIKNLCTEFDQTGIDK